MSAMTHRSHTKRVALISVALATGAALSLAALLMHSKPVAPVDSELETLMREGDAENALAVKNMKIRATMESSERMLLATVEMQCSGRAPPAWCADGVPVHARYRQILPMPAVDSERGVAEQIERAKARADANAFIDRVMGGRL